MCDAKRDFLVWAFVYKIGKMKWIDIQQKECSDLEIEKTFLLADTYGTEDNLQIIVQNKLTNEILLYVAVELSEIVRNIQ